MKAIILALAILVAGCQSLATPQTFDQRIAYAYGSVTATLHTCRQLYERDRLTHEQGSKCLALTDQASTALALAQGTSDPQTAGGFLQVAIGMLTQLEVMLQEAQK